MDPSVCEHPNIVNITAGEGSGTYTHPYWVGNKPNGDPILDIKNGKEYVQLAGSYLRSGRLRFPKRILYTINEAGRLTTAPEKM